MPIKKRFWSQAAFPNLLAILLVVGCTDTTDPGASPTTGVNVTDTPPYTGETLTPASDTPTSAETEAPVTATETEGESTEDSTEASPSAPQETESTPTATGGENTPTPIGPTPVLGTETPAPTPTDPPVTVDPNTTPDDPGTANPNPGGDTPTPSDETAGQGTDAPTPSDETAGQGTDAPTPTNGNGTPGETAAPTAGETSTPVHETPTAAPTPTAASTPTPVPPTPAFCGNGLQDEGEACDDGNGLSGDGCDASCNEEEDWICSGFPSVCEPSICGDGNVTSDEECDDGDANSDLSPDSCRTDCTLPYCGDGIKDSDETCDQGDNNSDEDANSCRTDCTLPSCGDGVLDLGEQCDDGDANSNTEPDACRTNCTDPRCGDGITDSEEACDDGVANSDTSPDSCRTDCALPYCGDGILDSGEACDDGDENADDQADTCRTSCELPTCGDGIIDTGEQCDDGNANNDELPDSCRTNCLESTCGDGVVDDGEACDNGDDNSDSEADACRLDCELPVCGDGVIDEGEACDDGDDNSDTDSGACRTSCELPVCGDGIVDPGEGCDDGNDSDEDECLSTCELPTCGDGFVNPGEECDEGDGNSDSDPDTCRETCVDPSCGDGVVDTDEACDDGAENSDTAPGACRNDCQESYCGDGVVDPGETCDEGDLNSDESGLCSSTCALNVQFEDVLTLDAEGDLISGDWDDFYERVTEEAADCRVRFDGRVAEVEHVEYATNSVYLDFQPLHAYHDGWDSYAYIHLNKGIRAGLGSTYRKGHGSYVHLKDRDQHSESVFTPMEVSVFCPRQNPYDKVATFNTRGEATSGSFDALYEMITERGADCKVRADKRVMHIENIEVDDHQILFDILGLYASHNTWDAYTYIDIDFNNRAGMGTSYRRGHGDNVYLKNQDQHPGAAFETEVVDVYCNDSYRSVARVLYNGDFIEGDWDYLYQQVAEDGRDCKVQYDDRLTDVKYTEYDGDTLRLDFATLSAYYDSWDAYAFAKVTESGLTGIGTNYRRGRAEFVHLRSEEQHDDSRFIPQELRIFCEAEDFWESVYTISSDGDDIDGNWADFYQLITDEAADCKVRFDERIGHPELVEFTDGQLLFDYQSLSGKHDNWDAYASHVVQEQNDTGISGSYRRGNATVVYLKDREQNSLATLQPHDLEFLCRRPVGFDRDTCGNGEIDPGETCDDGAANSDSDADSCRTDCQLPTCGDGVIDDGEDCDDGDDNGNGVGSSCSSTCQDRWTYEHVVTMTGDGTIVEGDWDDVYDRITDEASDCKVRFDDRIAQIENVEYSSSTLLLDFQPLHAYHDGWDAYAYIALSRGSRAGLGTSYRKGHVSHIALKDRDQHSESGFYPMTVDVFCARENPYQKIATVSTSGTFTHGSWDELYTRTVEEAADCKVRVDRRIFKPEHIEYGETKIYFDVLGLHASHNTWDAYAYAEVDYQVRAGLAASYRKGHADTVYRNDRAQNSEFNFDTSVVDIYCAESFEEVITIVSNGDVVEGDWQQAFDMVVEEGRTCKVAFEDRVANVPYLEYQSGDLRFDFHGLNAHHDSWDSYTLALFAEYADSGLATTYRRGRSANVWDMSDEQHNISYFFPQEMRLLCEAESRWENVLSLDYEGYVEAGSWDRLMAEVGEQANDCKVRFDGRIGQPVLAEIHPSHLLLDYHSLAGRHDSHDAYATHLLDRQDLSGVGGSYRRGNATTVHLQDRDQYALESLQPMDMDILCRRPQGYLQPVDLCGNGEIDLGEACDDGDGNSDEDADACRSDCSLATCGDGIIDEGEACDDGDANGNGPDASCSSTCSDTLRYDHVLQLSSDGAVLAGDWDDFRARLVDDLAECKVKFDRRVAKIEHVEYNSNAIFLDFQPLHAYHDGWDAYGYITLQKGVKAGVAASYRRGHASYVALRDREQHNENEFRGMTVDLYCERSTAYEKVAEVSSNGSFSEGSFSDLYDTVSQYGADCKVRTDGRIFKSPHIEYDSDYIYFDTLGLNASHNTWDAYAYVTIEEGNRAGMGASYRRGHDDIIYGKDRTQHNEAYFDPSPVDIYCADSYDAVLTVDSDGLSLEGSFDDLLAMVQDEARDCKVAYDGRISDVPYAEYHNGILRLDFHNLHAWHDSWDTYTFAHISEDDFAYIGTSYRRGRSGEVWKRSANQHSGGDIFYPEMTVFCESEANWAHQFSLSYDGYGEFGSWDDLAEGLIHQGADCKIRSDERITNPRLIEYHDGRLHFDYHGLSGQHDSWDAYATHVLTRGQTSGITGNYRRGHDDIVTLRDVAQHNLDTLQEFDVDVLCR